MASPQIPPLLFIDEKTQELADERLKPILELDLDESGQENPSFVDKWMSKLELQTGFELQDGCTGIFNIAYSNRTGNLFYNSRKGIVKYQIEQLSSMIQNMKRTQPKIILQKSGSLFLSPKETKILIVNFDNLYFFQIAHKFMEIKVVKNSFRFTNAFWDDEDNIYLWTFKNKLFAYSIENDSLHQITEIQECLGISRLHRNNIGIFQGNMLHIFVERKRIKEVNFLFLSNDECPFFEDTMLIGISKINNLSETTFKNDDIYVLIGVYYKQDAENHQNPCNRYIFYLRGNFFDEGRLIVRGKQSIEPFQIDESYYLSEDKKTKLPFSCIFQSSEKFTILLIEKSASLILVDATKKFEQLQIFKSKKQHSYIIPPRSKSQFFKGMAIMKNMIPLEEAIVNNDPFLKMICNEDFKGQFMRLFFADSQTELIIEFPFSALTVTDDLIIRKYVSCTIDGCNRRQNIEKFIKKVGRSKYIQVLHEGERLIDGESKDQINIKDENQQSSQSQAKDKTQFSNQVQLQKQISPNNTSNLQSTSFYSQNQSRQSEESIAPKVIANREKQLRPLLPSIFETSLISPSEKQANPFESPKIFQNSSLTNKKDSQKPGSFSSSYSSFSKLLDTKQKLHTQAISTQQQKGKEKEKEPLLEMSKKYVQRSSEKPSNVKFSGFAQESQKIKLKIQGYSNNENTPQLFGLNSIKSLIKKWDQVFDQNSPQVFHQITTALENLSFYHKIFKSTVFQERTSLKQSQEATSNNFIKTRTLVELTCYFAECLKNKKKDKKRSVFGSALKNSHVALKNEEDQCQDYLAKRIDQIKRTSESLLMKTQLEIKNAQKTKKIEGKRQKYTFDPNLESDSDNDESKQRLKTKALAEKSKKQKQQRKLILAKALQKQKTKKQLEAYQNKVIIIRMPKSFFSFQKLEQNAVEEQNENDQNIPYQTALENNAQSHNEPQKLSQNSNSKPKSKDSQKNGKIPMSNKIMNNQFVIPQQSENDESETDTKSLSKKTNPSAFIKNDQNIQHKVENKFEPQPNERTFRGSSFGAPPFGSSPFGGSQFNTFSKLRQTSTPFKPSETKNQSTPKPDGQQSQIPMSNTTEIMNPLIPNSTLSSGIVQTVIQPSKKEYKSKVQIKKGTVTNKELEKKKKLQSKSKSSLNANEDVQEKHSQKKSEETKKSNPIHAAVVKITQSKKPTEPIKKTQFGSQISDPFKKQTKVETVEQTKPTEVSTNPPAQLKKQGRNPFQANSQAPTAQTQNIFQANDNLYNPFKPSAKQTSQNQTQIQQGKAQLQNKGTSLHPSPVFGSGNSRFMIQNSTVPQQHQTFNPSSSTFGASTAGYKTFTNLAQSNNSFIQPFSQQQQSVEAPMPQQSFLQHQNQNNSLSHQPSWIPNTPMNPFAQQQQVQSSPWIQNNQQNAQGVNLWSQNNSQSGSMGNAGINPSLMQPRK